MEANLLVTNVPLLDTESRQPDNYTTHLENPPDIMTIIPMVQIPGKVQGYPSTTQARYLM